MWSKFSKPEKVTFTIGCMLVMTWLLVCFFEGCGGQPKEILLNNIIRAEPGLSLSGDVGFEPYAAADSVKLEGTSGITIDANVIEFMFTNDEKNVFDIRALIFLGDGREVYMSDLIAPGDSISNAITEIMLEPGKYKNSVLAYKVYTGTGAFVTQCEFPIEINVL